MLLRTMNFASVGMSRRNLNSRLTCGSPNREVDSGWSVSIVYEAPKNSGPMRMLELTQRLGLNLADPFARYREPLTDFFKRLIGGHPNAESHANYALFARAERGEGTGDRVPQV